jgi:hypothetical protein
MRIRVTKQRARVSVVHFTEDGERIRIKPFTVKVEIEKQGETQTRPVMSGILPSDIDKAVSAVEHHVFESIKEAILKIVESNYG